MEGIERKGTATPGHFWDKVVIGPIDSCWEWQGCFVSRDRPGGGYGRLTYKQKSWLSHRLAYSLSYGEIPRDKPVICRLKDGDLFAGTAYRGDQDWKFTIENPLSDWTIHESEIEFWLPLSLIEEFIE